MVLVDNKLRFGGKVAIERLKQSTTAESAMRAVRNAILDGTFPPVSQLREVPIATELGTSRAPVREALRHLEREGLIVRVPFRGAFVAEISPRAAAEIAALRAILEPYAVECALPYFATTEGRAELVDTVNRLSERTAAEDRPGSIEAHLAVHALLYRASGNQALYETWKSWESQLRLFLAADHQSFPQLSELAVTHRALLAAIESGDTERIRRELAWHIHSQVPESASGPGDALEAS
jgi:DNA-binding GntR family transcriptional regulator